MDSVLQQLNNNESKNRSKNIFKIIYSIYHLIAEAFLSAILIILIVVGFMISWYFIDQMNNIKKGINAKPMFGAYVIISPSMEPTIKVQDAVVIKRKSKEDLKVNDIITFLSSDSRFSGITITHRIVGIEKSEDGEIYFRTKGDNNNAEDSALVKPENVFGKVILKIPMLGYIRYVLTTSVGMFVFIVIPCLGIVIYDILKLFKTVSRKITKTSNNKKRNAKKNSKSK